MKPIYGVAIGVVGGLCVSIVLFGAMVWAWGGDSVLVFGPFLPFGSAALAWLGAIVGPILLR